METLVDSPLGTLRVAMSERGVRSVVFGRHRRDRGHRRHRGSLGTKIAQQFGEYFSGTRTKFDLPLDIHGTEFQKNVWKALGNIPHGTTVTYGALAKMAGRPTAIRATASAVANNPVAVILPCHRIVPASKNFPGKFAWGSLRKAWLLKHEVTHRT